MITKNKVIPSSTNLSWAFQQQVNCTPYDSWGQSRSASKCRNINIFLQEVLISKANLLPNMCVMVEMLIDITGSMVVEARDAPIQLFLSQ